MKKTLVFAALVATACAVGAVTATSVATTAATSAALSAARGSNVASQQARQTAERKPNGLCFFQVPGKLGWVNLAHIQKFQIDNEGWNGEYRLMLDPGYSQQKIEIKIPKGADLSSYSNLVLQRIEECRGA